MQKHLYFICPTDHLETIIHSTFSQENYYYTSLGNSITFDTELVRQLQELLVEKDIREISFILSDDNRIISDALGNHDFSKISGLDNFYCEIIRQKEFSEELWQSCNLRFLILSNYLNTRIKELKLRLKTLPTDQVKINGKVYSRQTKIFSDIYVDLICRECFSLNWNVTAFIDPIHI